MRLATRFFYAAMFGNAAQVQEFLEQDPTLPQLYGPYGTTALHLAVYHGRRDIVTLLLAYGANIEAQMRDRTLCYTPLHVAILMNQLEMARLLLEEGANVHAPEVVAGTPLHLAVMHGNAEMVRLLLAHGARLDLMDVTGLTALRLARRRRSADVVAALCGEMPKATASDNNSGPSVVISGGPTAHVIGPRAIRNEV
jgi:ankyrin repeat protein